MWVAKLMDKFNLPSRPFLIKGDSAGAIAALKNVQYTKHTKHIDIHKDFLRDQYKMGELDFELIRGQDNVADIFTKPLPQPAFQKHRTNIGMMELPPALR